MRIGLVLEVTTSFQHFKYGIEIRMESVNQDDSHSWVRISDGTVKYETDSIEDNTENPADPQEEENPQTSTSVVAARSKAKGKPQPRGKLLGRQQLSQYTKEDGFTLSHPSKISIRTVSRRKVSIFFDTIKRYIEKGMEQLNFARSNFHLRNHHSQMQHRSDDRWKACLGAGGGSKRRYQHCFDNLGTILYLRALQRHSETILLLLRYRTMC